MNFEEKIDFVQEYSRLISNEYGCYLQYLILLYEFIEPSSEEFKKSIQQEIETQSEFIKNNYKLIEEEEVYKVTKYKVYDLNNVCQTESN